MYEHAEMIVWYAVRLDCGGAGRGGAANKHITPTAAGLWGLCERKEREKIWSVVLFTHLSYLNFSE